MDEYDGLSLSRVMREMREKEAAARAAEEARQAAAARAAEEARAADSAGVATGGVNDEKELDDLHEDLPGEATLQSTSTEITAGQPRPPVPFIDDGPVRTRPMTDEERWRETVEVQNEKGEWVVLPGAWVRPASVGGGASQAAPAPSPSQAPDQGAAATGGESDVFKEARRIAAQKREEAQRAAATAAPKASPVAPSEVGTTPGVPETGAPEVGTTALEPDAPTETPEEAAAREAAEEAKVESKRKEKEDQRYISAVRRVYKEAISDYVNFLSTNPDIARLERYLSDLVLRHMNTLDSDGMSMFYQASAAKVVAILERDIIPGIKRFTQENLKTIFVNSRIPQRWVLPLTKMLGEMVQHKFRDRNFSMNDFLERMLAHLEASARRDGTFGPEEEAFLDKYDEDMAAANQAEAARLTRGGRPDGEVASSGEGPPRVGSPERRETIGGTEEIFLERIDVTSEYWELFRSKTGTARTTDEDSEIHDEVLNELEGKYNETILEMKFQNRPTYYFEFDVLDEDKCEAYVGRTKSQVVKLIAEGRIRDYQREHFRVLRTFDDRLLKGPEDRNFLELYFDTSQEAPEARLDRLGMLYTTYGSDLSNLFHRLKAGSKADVEGSPPSPLTLEDEVAKLMIDKVKTLEGQAKKITGEVNIRVADITEGEGSQWKGRLVTLDKAFKAEIGPLLASIDNVVKYSNTINDLFHESSNSISNIVALSKKMNDEMVSRVANFYPKLDRAAQLAMIAIQRKVNSVDRSLPFNFLRRDPITRRDEVEEDIVLMLRLEFPDMQKSEAEYLGKLAASIHIGHTGEFLEFLAKATDGELMTQRNIESGEQRRTGEDPTSAVLDNLGRISSVKMERYGSRLNAVKGVFVSRFMGTAPRHKETRDDYSAYYDEQRVARGKGATPELLRRLREGISIQSLINKQVADNLAAGGWHSPNLMADANRFKAQAQREIDRRVSLGPVGGEASPMDLHISTIKELNKKWGTRGVIFYIEENLDALMDLDPQYADELKKKKKLQTDAEGSARAPSIRRGLRNMFGGPIKIGGLSSPIEGIRKVRTEARAKYFAQYVYRPLLIENPAMVLLLEHRGLTIGNLVRDKLGSKMATMVGVSTRSDLSPYFRAVEILAQHHYGRLGIRGGTTVEVNNDKVKLALEHVNLPTDRDSVASMLEVYSMFISELQTDVTTNLEKYANEFALDHVSNIGSYNSQLTGHQVALSNVLTHHVDSNALGLEARVKIVEALEKLIADNGTLIGIELPNVASVEAAVNKIFPDLNALGDLMTQNPNERLRIKAYLVIICANALIDNSQKPSIYDPKGRIHLPGVRTDIRVAFLKGMVEKLGIPDTAFSVERESDGTYKGSLNPIMFSDMAAELGIDLDHRARKDFFDKMLIQPKK